LGQKGKRKKVCESKTPRKPGGEKEIKAESELILRKNPDFNKSLVRRRCRWGVQLNGLEDGG
jgi:hypothetical protein